LAIYGRHSRFLIPRFLIHDSRFTIHDSYWQLPPTARADVTVTCRIGAVRAAVAPGVETLPGVPGAGVPAPGVVVPVLLVGPLVPGVLWAGPGVPTPDGGAPTPLLPGVPTPLLPGVPTPLLPGVPMPLLPGVPTPLVPLGPLPGAPVAASASIRPTISTR
jgi:hypothetical protein